MGIDQFDPACDGAKPSNALDVALSYIARGWSPLPVPFKTKEPKLSGWPKLRINEQSAPQYFNGAPQNVGVILGEASAGLTDIDLDCRDAINIAPYVLPPRTALFGRASKRSSHWLYITDLAATESEATLQFEDPTDGSMLVEIRCGGGGKGAQTVFPGSTHECGEAITWETEGAPAEASGTALKKRVALLAACCLFARNWPDKTGRHNAALTVTGFLHRAGFAQERIKAAIEGVARAARDEEWKDRVKTAEIPEGKHPHGFPKPKECFGEAVARKVAEWLGYDSSKDKEEAGASAQQPSARKTIRATAWKWKDPKTFPRRAFLYGTHIIRKFTSADIAPPGTGKSFQALTEDMAMAINKPLLGMMPTQRCRVWHFNGEDPAEELDRRILATCILYGITREELEGWLFADSGRDQEIVIAHNTRDGTKIFTPVVDEVIATIRENGIDSMTIDPFISSHRVTENDNNAIDVVVKRWAYIADVTNAAVRLVHHSRKTDGAEVTVEDSRGASATLAGVRSARVLNIMTAQEAEQAGINPKVRRLYFRVEDGKSNIAPPADAADWYHIKSVFLGNGDPANLLDHGDNVGVLTKWTWPDPMAGVTGQDFEKVASVIRAGRWRENPRATAWVGKAVAEALNLDLEKKTDRAKILGMLKVWRGSDALIVVKEPDEKREMRKWVKVAIDE